MKILKFFCLAIFCLSCDDKPLPPCQLSQTGWVCADVGVDASKTIDTGVDMKKKSEDLSPDLSPVDVRPEVDMKK